MLGSPLLFAFGAHGMCLMVWIAEVKNLAAPGANSPQAEVIAEGVDDGGHGLGFLLECIAE